jgi:hypothetical protein
MIEPGHDFTPAASGALPDRASAAVIGVGAKPAMTTSSAINSRIALLQWPCVTELADASPRTGES